jgi:hypothetical protein
MPSPAEGAVGEGQVDERRRSGRDLSGLPLPMKIRTDISASLATGLAREARLDVAQPNVIRPSVRADRGPMAALIIGAIDQQAAHADGRISPRVMFCGGSLRGLHSTFLCFLIFQPIAHGNPGDAP